MSAEPQLLHATLVVVWLHFIADFLLQTDKMAVNKSKSFSWLTVHVAVYSGVLCAFCGPWYALVNGVAHYLTDAVTSRVTSYLWKRSERHWFFVVIGLDQALHLTVLVLTTPLIWWYV